MNGLYIGLINRCYNFVELLLIEYLFQLHDLSKQMISNVISRDIHSRDQTLKVYIYF